MPNTRSQFQRLMFPGLRDFIFRGFKEKPEQFGTMFNVMSSDSAFEEDMIAAGVGLFRQWDELTESSEDRFVPGLEKRYDHVDYGLRMGFSEQFIRDTKINIANDRGRDMGFSCRQTKEILVADVFNSGFSTNGYDGVPLFSASHPITRGGGSGGQLQSNLLSTAASVSTVSVRAMMTMFRLFVDETGVRLISLTPKWLWHHPAHEWDVLEILKSAGRPDTANRADNVIRNRLEPFTWDYLTAQGPWGMTTDKSEHKLKVYNRVNFKTRTFQEDKTETQWVQARFAFSYGYSHYLGTVASNASL